ncbi:uncharacterized protein PV09_04438 [Verruconis gallopava]|uniref:Uncharacterized protein n=1 Tax=Verruconis gallopava TaxID=253628 RepID=A0A0D2AE14_9PEZI|nr:uncharacterized protein PV09_04438 [Verruconis gallopava]KIW04705.1 hypothetical protein PV09_04438 [Verruconis gallopava]
MPAGTISSASSVKSLLSTASNDSGKSETYYVAKRPSMLMRLSSKLSPMKSLSEIEITYGFEPRETSGQ